MWFFVLEHLKIQTTYKYLCNVSAMAAAWMSDVPAETFLHVLFLLAIHILANAFSQCCLLHMLLLPPLVFCLLLCQQKKMEKSW